MYYKHVKQRRPGGDESAARYERREDMEEMSSANEMLLRAILELIDKCNTMEELRESVKRILNDDK